MKRQNLRKLLLLVSLLLFPVTIYYLSPYLIIMGLMEGIINGSFIVFGLMLIGSICFSRLFCGYICPIGGLQEFAFAVNSKEPRQGWRNNLKYVIWIIWIGAVIFSYMKKEPVTRIDFFYQTEFGISVSNIYGYIIYYGIIVLTFIPTIIFGKRVFCHYFCWIAPFMVIGTKISRLFHLPGLHISSDSSKCISCKQCNKKCPMSIDVVKAAKAGNFDNMECIQCGECVDVCPKNVLKYRMKYDD